MIIPIQAGSTASATRTQPSDILMNPIPNPVPPGTRTAMSQMSIFILVPVPDMVVIMVPPFLMEWVGGILIQIGVGTMAGAGVIPITEDTAHGIIHGTIHGIHLAAIVTDTMTTILPIMPPTPTMVQGIPYTDLTEAVEV